MSTQRMMLGFVVIAVSAFLGISAQAGNNRSVVSTTGLDTNNCSVPAPCRSFAAALAQTNPGGEIIVLDSGGYGPATITQPVTIVAIGVRASVFQATANPGFTINTTGNVVIKGIAFLGGLVGTNGIFVQSVATLYLDNVEVQEFTSDGISFIGANAHNLVVSNSVVRDCLGHGLTVGNGMTFAKAYVRGSSFLNNGGGIPNGGGVLIERTANAVVVDSVASFNLGSGFESAGGLDLVRVEAAFNGNVGFSTDPIGSVNFVNSLSDSNLSGAFSSGNLSTMSGSSPGTSLLIGGGDGGTALAAAKGLQ